MIGIDVVDLNRIDLANRSFAEYILTDEELAEYDALSNDRVRIDFLGGHFAAKEAIFKATQDRNYLNYAVLHESGGKPYVKDHPEIQLSISHDGGIAAAIVMITR